MLWDTGSYHTFVTKEILPLSFKYDVEKIIFMMPIEREMAYACNYNLLSSSRIPLFKSTQGKDIAEDVWGDIIVEEYVDIYDQIQAV
jgi:hypothetical protein